MERYKAILWRTPGLGYLSQEDVGAYGISTPVDTALLKKKCYSTAEDIFFNQRSWKRSPDYHVEIEEAPRIVETEA
tara:strand:+ start:2935 stop:3162 length:228 start_codon:yes stop_codon:yes gene_type:complete